MRFYARTTPNTGVSVGVIGFILIATLYIAVLATFAVVALAVLGVLALIWLVRWLRSAAN